MDTSPVFDGSEYSLGGNGEFVPGHRAGVGGARPGSGGGCLTSGPFSNFTVNMGPVGSRNPLQYNPRCIKRDLNTDICSRWATLRSTTEPILNSPDVAIFQAVVQGDGRWPEAARVGIAVHGGGHYSISGDPGGDFYFSSLEPGFYLHHGNIDRMHFIWQNLDWENRQVRWV
jgi:tyrosinase